MSSTASVRTSRRSLRRRFTKLPRSLVALLAAALALALYALLGFQLAPILLRKQAISWVRERYGRELELGEVFVQPFSFSIALHDLALPDADGQLLIGWQRASLDFQPWASLWQRAFVFRDISLSRPRLRAELRPGGALNLSDLGGADGHEAASTSEPPRLTIEQLSVRDGALEFSDRARQTPFSQRFAPITFSLRGFRTTARGGVFSLSARSAPAQRFWWQGSLALAPEPSSSGRFAWVNVPAAQLAEYLGDALPFAISEGRLAVAGTYQAKLGEHTQADLQLSGIKLEQLAVHVRGAPKERVSVETVQLSDSKVSLQDAQVEIGHVAVSGLSTRAVLEPDGTLNLARLARSSQPDTPSAGPPWRVRVHGLTVAGAVQFEDRGIVPAVKLDIVSLGLALQELTLDPEQPIHGSLQLRLDDQSLLRIAGHATREPAALALEVALEHARVTRLQPYLQPFADLTVHDGRLAFHGHAALSSRAAGPAALEVEGDVVLTGLRTTDNALGQPFVDLERLELKRLKYRNTPESIEVAEVALDRPYARLVLSSQQTLNVSSILHGKTRTPSAVQERAPTAMSLEHPVAKVELGPTQVRVGKISINDMRLSFTDHFIRPNFAAEIHRLRGSLEGLSTDSNAEARLSLVGTLGASAQVSIAGRLRPFAFAQSSDIKVSWQNVPLPVFNPYSGRFAGYSIVRGDLATQLHYKLQKGKLDAQHHIRVDQLTWGEATATKEQAALPVRLATAMLRDRHGVITLDIPVEGNLDDPTFHVGPLLWQAVKNVAVRAATAPFEWLGSLFHGAEKARFVVFVPGDATLDSTDRAQLGSLANALAERPNLHVDVPLAVDRALDRGALVERKYQRELKSTIADELWGARKNAPYSALDQGDRIDVLEALYERLTKSEPELPSAPEPPADSSWSQRRALRRAFTVGALERMTRSAIKVEDRELEQLGLRRANAIEQALTADGKVETHRVLVSSEARAQGDHGRVRVELALQ
ncbi:MAG: hypothetical protein JWN48_3947 [Myxococcaceae bacterium]|nr:hypothetical protein [Myxococcaceae bacterium]